MELGATVCTVKSPMCSSCPLQDTCLARILTTETQATAAAVASPPHNLTGGIQKNKKKKKQSGESGSNEQGGSCGCDVCEIGEDGLVELPREVTEFPRKAAKTYVSACAVQYFRVFFFFFLHDLMLSLALVSYTGGGEGGRGSGGLKV